MCFAKIKKVAFRLLYAFSGKLLKCAVVRQQQVALSLYFFSFRYLVPVAQCNSYRIRSFVILFLSLFSLCLAVFMCAVVRRAYGLAVYKYHMYSE